MLSSFSHDENKLCIAFLTTVHEQKICFPFSILSPHTFLSFESTKIKLKLINNTCECVNVNCYFGGFCYFPCNHDAHPVMDFLTGVTTFFAFSMLFHSECQNNEKIYVI